MPQQVSPFLESKYGWSYGENNWNVGADENWLKFSYLHDGNVDSIVSSLPAASNGAAHFLTTDNRFYFSVGTTWYSSPCPKWFIFKIKSTGIFWQFNGTAAVEISNPTQANAALENLQGIVDGLGTAAFQPTEFFASQSELDVASSQSNEYTDNLRTDLANNADVAKGAGLVGWVRSALADTITTVGGLLNSIEATPWEYANLVVSRPTPGDPSTWDWTPALNALFTNHRSVFLPPGNYRITESVFIPSNTTVRGTRASKIFMSENPSGYNLVCVKDSENVTIQGFSIIGVSGAGTEFPTPGVVDGQGVCFIAYGSANVSIIDMYSSQNGVGSGNFYFATCRDSRIVSSYVEKTSNAFCVDNYYDAPPSAPCNDYSRNIIIANNTANDVAGRGVAIDAHDSADYDNNFMIIGNTVRAAAWAGVQVNAKGSTIIGNTIEGRRDQGRSTMGGQQSEPTYYGFLSDLGGQFTRIIDNTFNHIYKNGIRIIRNENADIKGNTIIMATSFYNQYTSLVELIADKTGSQDNHSIFCLTDEASPVGPGDLKITDNYIYSARDHASSGVAPNQIGIYILTLDVPMRQKTNISILNNDMNDAFDASKYIQIYVAQEGKYGSLTISGNKITSQNTFSSAISVPRADIINIHNNCVIGCANCVEIVQAGFINSVGNLWSNSAVGFSIQPSNIADYITSLIISDTFNNISTRCYDAAAGLGGPVVTNSDASGSKYVACPTNKIKNNVFPNNIRGLRDSTSPASGYWGIRDRVEVETPTTFTEWVCTTEGSPGMWQTTGAIT